VNLAQATTALESIDPKDLVPYREYFEKITPVGETEVFRRFLFAFASVHTGWVANVNLYSLLWGLTWTDAKTKLHELVMESRAGLTNGRTDSIWEFNERYWAEPEWYLKRDDELWPQYRDRIQLRTHGLGHAKSSFAVEMIYPNNARVICGDTHMLQNFGLKGNSAPGQKVYNYVESHWVSECFRLGLAPVAARWHLWDRKQGKTNSTYWSYCIEGGKPGMVLPRQLELFTWKDTMIA
jgi:hypothetical protein